MTPPPAPPPTHLRLCDLSRSESRDRRGSAAVQKARGFYRSCLDTESIDAAGAGPFLALIQKVRGVIISDLTGRGGYVGVARFTGGPWRSVMAKVGVMVGFSRF